MPPLVMLVVVLLLAGLALWVIGQLPIDATIMRIIRVVVIVVAVLYCLQAFGLMPAHWMYLDRRR